MSCAVYRVVTKQIRLLADNHLLSLEKKQKFFFLVLPEAELAVQDCWNHRRIYRNRSLAHGDAWRHAFNSFLPVVQHTVAASNTQVSSWVLALASKLMSFEHSDSWSQGTTLLTWIKTVSRSNPCDQRSSWRSKFNGWNRIKWQIVTQIKRTTLSMKTTNEKKTAQLLLFAPLSNSLLTKWTMTVISIHPILTGASIKTRVTLTVIDDGITGFAWLQQNNNKSKQMRWLKKTKNKTATAGHAVLSIPCNSEMHSKKDSQLFRSQKDSQLFRSQQIISIYIYIYFVKLFF